MSQGPVPFLYCYVFRIIYC